MAGLAAHATLVVGADVARVVFAEERLRRVLQPLEDRGPGRLQ